MINKVDVLSAARDLKEKLNLCPEDLKTMDLEACLEEFLGRYDVKV